MCCSQAMGVHAHSSLSTGMLNPKPYVTRYTIANLLMAFTIQPLMQRIPSTEKHLCPEVVLLISAGSNCHTCNGSLWSHFG